MLADPYRALAAAAASSRADPNNALASTAVVLANRSIAAGMRSDALRVRAIALVSASRFPEAEAAFREACASALAAGDPKREARCLVGLGTVLADSGQRAAALDAYSAGLVLSCPGSRVRLVGLVNLGLMAIGLGDQEMAAYLTQFAYEQTDEPALKAGAAYNCAIALTELGRLTDAQGKLAYACQNLPAGQDDMLKADAETALHLVSGRLSDPNAVVGPLRALVQRCRSAGLTLSEIKALNVLGDIYLQARQIECAIKVGGDCLDLMQPGVHDVQRAEVTGWLPQALAAAGQWEAAYSLLREHQTLRQELRSGPLVHALCTQIRGLAARFAGWGGVESATAPSSPVPAEAAHRLGLSGTERAVLHHVAQGHTNPEIAAELGLSVNTVRNRLVRVMRKLGAKTRAEAVARAAAMQVRVVD